MALTELPRRVMRCLARNRSETSYAAGGAVRNREWPRQSEDLDIFFDTDEEIVGAARRDVATLLDAGFEVSVDIDIYGLVEARVAAAEDETAIQWMSESRRRFFPLVRDDEWGARLHQADLAVNKVVAASTRRKARDFVDLVSISTYMCPLGPLVFAAAGKSPLSPTRIVDEIRRRALSTSWADYQSVKGIPRAWDASFLHEHLEEALDGAEQYILSAPLEILGKLAVSADGIPVELTQADQPEIILRAATEEPEVMPQPSAGLTDWSGKGP